MTKYHRRRLLKSIGIALPAAWSTPVVQSIVLPAHAQMSPPESSTPGCPPMTIADFEVACDTTPDPGEETPLVVEESEGGCPVLATVSAIEPQPTATLITLRRRRFYSGASTGTTFASIGFRDPDGGSGIIIESAIDNCDSSDPFNCETIDNTPYDIVGTLGGSYVLTAEPSCADSNGTVVVFNISIV